MAQEIQESLDSSTDGTSGFREIIRELKRIRQDEQLDKLEDNILFDGAVRIYNSLLINRSVTGRKAMGRPAKPAGVPMTDKQRKLLEDLNYRGSMQLTKAEATKVIEERLANRKR